MIFVLLVLSADSGTNPLKPNRSYSLININCQDTLPVYYCPYMSASQLLDFSNGAGETRPEMQLRAWILRHSPWYWRNMPPQLLAKQLSAKRFAGLTLDTSVPTQSYVHQTKWDLLDWHSTWFSKRMPPDLQKLQRLTKSRDSEQGIAALLKISRITTLMHFRQCLD